jgi:hypothetical protein
VPDTDTEKDLVIEEYKACRELIGRNIEIIERNEVYVVGACAVVMVFAIDKGENILTIIIPFLPLVLAIIGLKRYVALDATISRIDKYIKKQESKYKIIGYTHHYESSDPNPRLGNARRSVWHVLILATSVFALYKTYAVINPLKDVCGECPRLAFLCRAPESSKNSN